MRAVRLNRHLYWAGVKFAAVTFALGGAVWILDAKAADAARILPSAVTLSNVETFKEQLIRDIPIGTTKGDVEAYLTKWKIVHSFVDPGSLIDENTFYGIIENIGVRMGLFPASLAIRIHVDAMDKVDRVLLRIDYLGP